MTSCKNFVSAFEEAGVDYMTKYILIRFLLQNF